MSSLYSVCAVAVPSLCRRCAITVPLWSAPGDDDDAVVVASCEDVGGEDVILKEVQRLPLTEVEEEGDEDEHEEEEKGEEKGKEKKAKAKKKKETKKEKEERAKHDASLTHLPFGGPPTFSATSSTSTRGGKWVMDMEVAEVDKTVTEP